MNIRVMNALRKMAAEQSKNEIEFDPKLYRQERYNAYALGPEPPRGRPSFEAGHGQFFYPAPSQADVIKQRPEQARSYAISMGMRPGSDSYAQVVKHLMERGKTNMYNFLNPSNPKPNPKLDFRDGIPKTDEFKKLLEYYGNLMGNNNRPGKKYEDIG